MKKALDKKFQHLPILTLVGRNLQRCDKILEGIADVLAEKSIDILVVYKHINGDTRKDRISTLIDRPCDTVCIDGEHAVCSEPEKEPERINTVLSQHYLSYDLIIFCKADNDFSEEIQIFEGTVSQGRTLFHAKADDDPVPLAAGLYDWLVKKLLTIPVCGCVLIGGKSSRMGRPKHLIEDADGITWGEKIVRTLSKVTKRVVLSGSGEIPQSLSHLERLVDISEAQGPLAGILAAMRWNPHVSFVVAACDMPALREESLTWLLGRRQPGVWGTVPRHPQSQRFEPLFAHYDYRSRVLFEQLLHAGSLRPNHVCKSEKIETPLVPANLADSWHNCNTPEDLSVLE
jgi:molybdopterin-guanine dinucleotide biosynthesis protein A